MLLWLLTMNLVHRCRLQLAGFLLSVLGWILTSTGHYLELEKSQLSPKCAGALDRGTGKPVQLAVGGTQCKDCDSFLVLPLEFKIARILVSTSNGRGLLGLVISSLGLDCLKMEDTEQKLEKQLLLLGGILLWLAGVLASVPISWVARTIIQEFWDEDIPEIVPTWEAGDALFGDWFGGFFFCYNSRGISTPLHNRLPSDHQLPEQYAMADMQDTHQHLKTEDFMRVDIRFSDFLLLHYS